MKVNICTFLIVLGACLVNYFCLQGDISKLLIYPLAIWLAFSLVLLFKPNLDKKNALTMVGGITCGVIISALLGRNMTWSQYVLRSVSVIIGSSLLWLYVAKVKYRSNP